MAASVTQQIRDNARSSCPMIDAGWSIGDTSRKRLDFSRRAYDDIFGDLNPWSMPNGVDRRSSRLWKAEEKVNGKLLRNYPQGTGDCVGFGGKNAIHATHFVEIAGGENETFRPAHPSYLYAIGRVLAGKNRLRGRGAGSLGGWQAVAVTKWGVLFLDEEGVPQYSGRLSDRWGDDRDGWQKWVPRGDDHLIGAAERVHQMDQLIDSIVNGFGVTIASSQGFRMEPGRDGFHRASGTWHHQMCVIGAIWWKGEWHFIVLNSWGDMHGRLRDFETDELLPVGCLRVRYDVMERMVRRGEAYAYKRFAGQPGRKDQEEDYSDIWGLPVSAIRRATERPNAMAV